MAPSPQLPPPYPPLWAPRARRCGRQGRGRDVRMSPGRSLIPAVGAWGGGSPGAGTSGPRCPRGHLVRGDAPFARGLGVNDKRCRKKGTRRRGAWGPRMSATSGLDDGGRGRGQRPWAAEQSCCAPSAQPGTRAWAGASSLPGPGTQGCGRAVLAARLGLGRPPPPALGRGGTALAYRMLFLTACPTAPRYWKHRADFVSATGMSGFRLQRRILFFREEYETDLIKM